MSYVNAAFAAAKIGGAIAQGRASKMNANTNAMALDYEADQEEQAAQQQADIIRRAGRIAVSRETAGYAASGVVVGEGSAAAVVDKTRTDATHDAYMTILSGEKKANALRAQGTIGAANASAQADINTSSATTSALSSMYASSAGRSGWVTKPAVTSGSNASGYNGTMNNPSAYVG